MTEVSRTVPGLGEVRPLLAVLVLHAGLRGQFLPRILEIAGVRQAIIQGFVLARIEGFLDIDKVGDDHALFGHHVNAGFQGHVQQRPFVTAVLRAGVVRFT